MTEAEKAYFKQKYQIALEQHLKRRACGRVTSRAARTLGREGLKLGLGILDVVRIHFQSAEHLHLPTAVPISSKEHQALTAASVFLVEALTPIETKNNLDLHNATENQKRIENRLTEQAQRYDQLLQESQNLQKQAQKLAHQVLLTQEEERKELSRELHDKVAQILAGINVRLAALKEAGVMNHQSLEQSIFMTQKLVEESVEAVHRFAKKLRPLMLDDLGLIPSLRSFIRDVPKPGNLEIRLAAYPGVESMDNIRRTVIFRVVQESIFNVIRHARAQVVMVCIQEIRNGVLLEVHDDGKGFNVDRITAFRPVQRLGLIGMKERVEMVGGELTLESVRDKGTKVSAEIPFKMNTRKRKT